MVSLRMRCSSASWVCHCGVELDHSPGQYSSQAAVQRNRCCWPGSAGRGAAADHAVLPRSPQPAPCVQDYDPSKTPRQHAGVELVRACADSMAFLESGPDREPSGDTLGTLGHQEDEKVQLMTMHKSKGLEFRVVILLGLSEWGMSLGRPGDADEYVKMNTERNLLYVAVTRAKDVLVLSSRVGLNQKPGKFARERHFGGPSWLLKALYKSFGVMVRERDEYVDVNAKTGSRWVKKRLLVGNKGYPEAEVCLLQRCIHRQCTFW